MPLILLLHWLHDVPAGFPFMTYFHFLDNGSKFDLILGKLVYFTMAKNNILNKSRIENIRKIWVSTLQIPFYYCIIWL